MSGRRTVLFVSEAVTLAQVVRLRVLAGALDPRSYEVHFAAAHFDERIFAGTDFLRWTIHSLSPAQVETRVRRGQRIHGPRVLRRYLAEDRHLLDVVRPQVVVGDFRPSLSVAAPLGSVPYAALINAYWSPFAIREAFPLPEHPIVSLLGKERAARTFPRALPFVFRFFAAPMNRLRRAHGLAPLGSLQEVLTHGDRTLFPDVPRLVPTAGAPASHRYLGPVCWAPALAAGQSFPTLPQAGPTVYVTLGSSGRAELLPAVLGALGRLRLPALVATAGRASVDPAAVPPGVFLADFWPGDQAAARADLVVCNGGSTTGYQALVAGRPVLCLPSNLDQYLASTAMEKTGAARLLRAGDCTADTVAGALGEMLGNPDYRRAAAAMAAELHTWDAEERFRVVIDELVSGRSRHVPEERLADDGLPANDAVRDESGAVLEPDRVTQTGT